MGLHDVLRHTAHGHGSVLTGRSAALYNALAGPLMGPLYRAVAAEVLAEVPQGGAVLDVGTGPGRLLLALARRRPDVRVVGIDPSADMVSLAGRNLQAAGLAGRAVAHVAAAEALPFPDASFDAVVSTLSAHHWADVGAAAAEQQRVLRPGGRLSAYDLRGTTTALAAELRARFPDAEAGRPRRGVAALLLVRLRGRKAATAARSGP